MLSVPLTTVGVPSVPPVVVTSAAAKPVGASLKVKVMVAVSPALRALALLVIVRVGAKVSPVIATELLTTLALPVEFVNAPAATLMAPVRELTPLVGV